ncbi:hypothetical protein C4577_07505 [Candidatus Parcubacteria bacterium]|nr:MAG: hypothetical protein C4577_07505 [Candidatus Parcubacteria bacterium]
MINLDTTTKSLEIILSGTVAANALQWHVSYRRVGSTSLTCSPQSTTGLISGATAISMVSGVGSNQVDEIESISVFNADTGLARATVQINTSGGVFPLARAPLQTGEALYYDGSATDGGGWYVVDASLARKTTASIGSVSSGAIISGMIGNGAVVSGSIASGQLSTYHFASGSLVTQAATLSPIWSGSSTPFITAEPISGVRAVSVSRSGTLQIAMASLSGRMPAVGVVVDNVASGIQVNMYTDGVFQLSSGLANYSGYGGVPLIVGRSGHIIVISGSWGSGGLLSGDIMQQIGVVANSGAVLARIDPTTSTLTSSGF